MEDLKTKEQILGEIQTTVSNDDHLATLFSDFGGDRAQEDPSFGESLNDIKKGEKSSLEFYLEQNIKTLEAHKSGLDASAEEERKRKYQNLLALVQQAKK